MLIFSYEKHVVGVTISKLRYPYPWLMVWCISYEPSHELCSNIFMERDTQNNFKSVEPRSASSQGD
jgi:hypothetical protein